MAYKSFIEIIQEEARTYYEDAVVKAIQPYLITVNKDELIAALKHDRAQYDNGYADGRAARDAEIIRCKDCKWYTPYRNIQGEEMGEGECEGFNPCVPADHYCSRGKRKESEDNTKTLEAWNLDGSPTRYIKGRKESEE